MSDSLPSRLTISVASPKLQEPRFTQLRSILQTKKSTSDAIIQLAIKTHVLGDDADSFNSPDLVKVTEENLDTVLNASRVTLLTCLAPWSPACRDQIPVLHEVHDLYPADVLFGQINVNREQHLVDRLLVGDLPWMVLGVEGDVMGFFGGFQTIADLQTLLDAALSAIR